MTLSKSLVVLFLTLTWLQTDSYRTYAQDRSPFIVGMSVQGYPAGGILTLKMAREVSIADVVSVYAGFNTTDRGAWGKFANEKGGGWGFGFAWRRYRLISRAGQKSRIRTGWFFGGRTDLWYLDIDWRTAGRPAQTGSTSVTVLQPTGQVGHTWLLYDDHLSIDAIAALGAEINIKTDGDPVGEGAIMLGGIHITYRF